MGRGKQRLEMVIPGYRLNAMLFRGSSVLVLKLPVPATEGVLAVRAGPLCVMRWLGIGGLALAGVGRA